MLTKGESVAYHQKRTILYRPANPPLSNAPDWIGTPGLRDEIRTPTETDEQRLYALAAITGSLVCERDRDIKVASLPATKADIAQNYAKWGIYLFGEFVQENRD